MLMGKRVRYLAGLCLCLVGFSGCALIQPQETTVIDVPVDVQGQQKAEQDEAASDYVAALTYWKGAKGTVDGKIAALRLQLTGIADRHVARGEKLYVQRKGKAALHEFIEALRYNPDNSVALDYLLHRYTARKYTSYTVQQGDTFESIAENIYGNHLDSFFIQQFAIITTEDELVPGLELELPLSESFYSQPILDYMKDIGFARKLYKDNDFAKVIPFAKELLKKHPDDEETSFIVNNSLIKYGKNLGQEGKYDAAISVLSQVDIRFRNVSAEIDRLKATRDEELKRDSNFWNSRLLQKGDLLVAEEKYLEALDVYNGVDPEFAGLEKAISAVRAKLNRLAEVHYKEGVKYFIEDDLASAISQWSMTLKFNPEHRKAMNYSVKAQQLLKKYEELKKE